MLRTTGALLATLALAAPAAAAPPWEPYRQAQVGCDCDQPWQFAFGASGGAIAVTSSEARRRPFVATRSPAGAWTGREGPRVGRATLGVYGDRALLLGTIGSDSRVRLASGRLDGTFGQPRDLGRGERAALAVHPSGAAIAAWARAGSVVVMRRAPSRAFGRPVQLGAAYHHGTPPAVAVNRRGEAVVMWRARNLRTVLTPIGRTGRIGTAIVLGRTDATDRYAAALADDGRWVAAWITQRFFARGGFGPATVSGFTGSIHGRTSRGRQLDTLQESVPGSRQLHARVDSGGDALVAWQSSEYLTGPVSGERRIVRYATGARELGDPETIRVEDRHAFLADLETGPRGQAALLWYTSNGPNDAAPQEPPRLYARHRPAAAQPFGSDEPIDDLVGMPAVAFDPGSARPLAIWDSLRESFRG